MGNVLIEKHVAIPMRDGVITYADVYRPADGAVVPGIVTRTPYDKEVGLSGLPVAPSPQKLAERGYAVVMVDTRGRFSSQGEFTPFVHEGLDGYDTIEWTAAQPWCDGNVGIQGPSYLGATTMLAARERPPSLRCAIPIITADDYYDGWVYQGGAYQLGFGTLWGMGLAAAQYLRRDHGLDPAYAETLTAALQGAPASLAALPLERIGGFADAAPWWRDWLDHDAQDDYWNAIRPSADYARFEVPMLHVGGWFDIFGIGTVRNFRGLTAAGRAPQSLIMGPWAHTSYDRYLGEMNFGPTGAAAFAGVIGAYNQFFDRHLKGGTADLPAVRYFVMGANEWRTADAWPPPEATARGFYLHSAGGANSARGDGALSADRPGGNEPADRYLYDPLRPVPTEGGPTLQAQVGLPGPRDQRAIEARDDVLCYTSEPLAQPFTIAGPVTVTLWATTDAPDTDWTAKLVDVLPDGRAVSLTDGIIRACFRDSLAARVPVTPNEPTRYTIDLANTAHRFGRGHRLRLEVSSSNFPRFQPNPNTGRPAASETAPRPAVQHVLHDGDRPSCLELWVLPQ